jgi:hypothetical protein
MTMSDHLQARLDKLALTELVAVLSAAVDRGDREAIIGCYAEESYDDHGGGWCPTAPFPTPGHP